jgi:lycopene beta-cyclase
MDAGPCALGWRCVDHLQYLAVMGACVVATLPLELWFGARVWRRPRRLVRALAPPLVIFCAWDIAAIAHHQWRYAGRYVTGVDLPGHLPIEEVVFFVVVPVCALLTFEVVTRMLGPDRRLPFPERLVPRRAAELPPAVPPGRRPPSADRSRRRKRI